MSAHVLPWPAHYPEAGNERGRPGVTVVIAACDRPDTLAAVLACLKRQTYRGWTAYVIGDCCDDTIAACVADARDPRIVYLNLAQRCGGQYGPNSVGLYLAETEFVAFLNHDDLWLPDHLELATMALEREGAEFYLGVASFAHANRNVERQLGRPVFSELNGSGPLQRAYSGRNFLFEPASSWVLRTDFAFRVGPWRPPYLVCRTSLQDWALRAWRLGPKLSVGDKVTVLKLNLHQRRRMVEGVKQPLYSSPQPLYGATVALIDRLGADGVRAVVDDDLAKARKRELHVRERAGHEFLDDTPRWIRSEAVLNILAQLYRLAGIDVLAWVLRPSQDKSRAFQDAVRKRTGHELAAFPGLADTLHCAVRQLTQRTAA